MQLLVVGDAIGPQGLLVWSGHLYWTDTNLLQIMRAPLDGSSVEVVHDTAPGMAEDLSVLNGALHWSERNTGRIRAMDIASGEVTDVLAGLTRPFGVHVVARPPCPADVTGCARTVDVDDLVTLILAWGTDGPGAEIAPPEDTIDVDDLVALIMAWGPCPSD
jgi:hypothetical protein